MKRNCNYIITLYLVIMGVILWILYSMVTHFGDDIGYKFIINNFSDKLNGWEPGIYVYILLRKWLLINGRFSDALVIGGLHWLPDWLLALITSICWVVTAVLILKLIKANNDHFFLKSFCLAFLWLGLPMWDRALLTAVAINYVWATCFGLIVAYWVINSYKGIPLFLKTAIIIFSFFAGMMHEGMSLPLLMGFITYELIQEENLKEIVKKPWKWFKNSGSAFRRVIIASFALGVLVVIASPALWRRFFNSIDTTPDAPIWVLFIKSDFLIIPLVIISGILMLYNRRIFNELIKSEWIIFAIGALVSAAISSVSGIVGRSGWFSQVYSLIALGIIFTKIKLLPNKIRIVGSGMGILLMLAVITCYISAISWQYYRWKEYNSIIKEYLASDDGIVYHDYVDDYEIPWYTLNMTIGIPDPDDSFEKWNIEEYLGNGKPLIILPQKLKNWHADESFPNLEKGFLTNYDISNFRVKGYAENEINIYKEGDNLYTVTPFVKDNAEFFYVRPLDLDPGDILK